jgi:very-short-patch-repair endonuclease
MKHFDLINYQGNNVEVIIYNDEPLFNANQVAAILDIKKVRNTISNYDACYKIKLTNKMLENTDTHINRKLHSTGENFLTKVGLLKLIQACRSKSSKEKADILKIFDFDDILIAAPAEAEFFESLRQVLNPMNIELITQHRVLNYRLDGYLPKHNLVIEYDELHHDNYKDKDNDRQQEITNELKCKFVRLDIRDTHLFNIGKVLSMII